MKSLYEITNGWMGESYVRAYAWADSEADALELCAAKHIGKKVGNKFEIVKLFDSDSDPFCTAFHDAAFTMELAGHVAEKT
jgi:hypothetical protein